MSVYFRCPCGAVLNSPDKSAMRAGECPTCGKIVVVPEGAVAVINVPRLTPQRGMPTVRSTPAPVGAAAAPKPASGVQVALPDQGVAAVADEIPDAFPEPEFPAAAEMVMDDEVAEAGVLEADVAEADVEADEVAEMEAVEDDAPVLEAEITDDVDGDAMEAEIADEPMAPVAEPLSADEAETGVEAVIEEPEPVMEEPVEKPARPKRTTSRMGKAVKSGRTGKAKADDAGGAPSKRSKKTGRVGASARVGRSGRHTGRSVPCEACGEPVAMGARKCRACGEPVVAKGGSGKIIVILLIVVVALVGGLVGVYYGKPDLLPSAIRGPLDGILGGGSAKPKKEAPAKDAPAKSEDADESEVVVDSDEDEPIDEDEDGPSSARDTVIPGMDDALDVDVPTLDFDETPATPAPAGDGEDIEL